MARPRKPDTTQVSVRIDVTVAKRTEHVIEALLRESPELRPFLVTLAAAYRLFLEKGLNVYEAELGLVAGGKPKPAAKRRAPR